MTKGSSKGRSRREFVGAAAVALTTLLDRCKRTGDHVAGVPQSPGSPARPQAVELETETSSFEFTFGQRYSSEQARKLLTAPRGEVPAAETIGTMSAGMAPTASGIGLPFWCDAQANYALINPTRLSFDPNIKPADYQLAATLLNFRASQTELGDVWKKLTNNAQLNINAGSVSAENDDLQWIVMTGINVAGALLSRTDTQLAQLAQNNKPTDSLRPAEAVTFKKGVCSLAITLSAQKKDSIWDKLLKAVKQITGSSIFGMLPIPKLYTSALQSVLASLNQLQTQSHLITILQGKSYGYKLYPGTPNSADLVFRPGHWVVLESNFASSRMDKDGNLSGVHLDVPGLLYQLKDSNNQPIDTTYTVAELDLNPVPS